MKIKRYDSEKDFKNVNKANKRHGVRRAVTTAAAVSAFAVLAVCADQTSQVRLSAHENVTGAYVSAASLKNIFLDSQEVSFSDLFSTEEVVMEERSVDTVLLNQDALLEAAVTQALEAAQIELAKVETVVSEVNGSTQAAETQSDIQSEALALASSVVEEYDSATEAQDAAVEAVKSAAEEAAQVASEEEAARIEAEEAAAAEAAAKAAEEAAAAEAAAKNTVTATYSSPISNISDEDYNNLLRIVQAEAENQGEIGKILVANVIVNRVKSSKFPNNITDVIFQDGQFSPVSNGRFYSVTVSASTKEAVDKALAGEDYSDGALYFVNYKCAKGWFNTLNYLFQYGDHVFYK
ncbi:MAG: cell wall hydrolase [Lachnospiraceae bacterium]|nr:cell wall hydrolase [Lachnospiraceae bacterium]